MAAESRVLSQRGLNRALLARQMLLERARTPIPRTLERMGTLQAQYALSMYIGLWTRLEGFEREQLDRALERRAVVQGTMMRATIHLTSARDYLPLMTAIRRAHEDPWKRAARPGWPTERELRAAAAKLRRALRSGPMWRTEIDELLGKPGSATINALNVLMYLLRVPPSGTWERRRADRYAAADEWLETAEVGLKDAQERLVRRYLGGFGPSTPKDLAGFAGLPVKAIAPALERLELRRFEAESGEELIDLPRAPLPDPDTPAPVRFLPTWDATLLAHARRSGILPEEFRPRIFNIKTPQSVSAFLVDGAVAGSWKHERGRIRIEPFRRLDAATRRELETEAERLAEFHE